MSNDHELHNAAAMMEHIRRRMGLGRPEAAPVAPPSVDSVMRRLRVELDRNSVVESAEHAEMAIEKWQPAAPRLAVKREYVLGELLALNDADFVENAYRIMLRRPPDQGGFDHYLSRLRSGNLSKIEVLGEIRWSPEGLARSVHVDGLLIPYKIHQWQRLPIVGPLLRLVRAIWRFPSLLERQARAEAEQAFELQQLGGLMNRVSGQVERQFIAFDAGLASLNKSLAEVSDGLAALQQRAAALGAAQVSLEELQQRHGNSMGQVESALRDLQERHGNSIGQVEQDLRDLQMRHGNSISQVEQDLRGLHERHGTSISQIEQALGDQQERHAASISQIEQALGDQQERHAASISQVEQALGQLQGRYETMAASHAAAVTQIEAGIDQIETSHGRLAEVVGKIERDTFDLTGLANRTRSELQPILQREATEAAAESSLEPLYAAFEERYRGSRELIRERALPYLDMVKAVSNATSASEVVDLGCGRGEWLELLKQNGVRAKGVDTNGVFLQECRDKGLDVVDADAIEALVRMHDNSVGVITSMHLIEHLPFVRQVQLLDEAHRVLREGGLLVLETPNPENLMVASEWFYLDPTHRNPIPPELLAWLVEARGFKHVSIRRLTEGREIAAPQLITEDAVGAASLNALISHYRAAPDYAVIACR